MTKNKKTLIRILVCLALWIAALVVMHTVSIPYFWIEIVVYAAIYLAIGYDVLWRAITNLFHGKLFDENFLMTVATIGAFAIGEYHDAVAVLLLYQTGELFQRYAVGKSRKNIAALLDIRPETATVVRDGTETEVHPSEISLGETFVVKAGEKLPLDGIVCQGACHLDTSAITGESRPRQVDVGSKVISGCINTDGVIYVTATSSYDDTTVAKILNLVENATEQKAPAENFITKFSKFYTPVVTVCALLIGIIPPLFLGTWAIWLRRAMMFLFVSCPCALVISVPMGFFGGIAAASKRGILVKGSNYLEVLSKTEIFAFDKTGTLTLGNFAVTNVYPKEKREDILSAAATAEQYSNHPIAVSICKEYDGQKSECRVQEIAGRGVVAQNDDYKILCGNLALMSENGIECIDPDEAGTVVHVAKDGTYLGAIVIADQLKDDSSQAIRLLKQEGCQTVMLTGDNQLTAQNVANKVGVDKFVAQLLPQDKVEQVSLLKSSGKKVAFVGDGINDAPVLATADVGIAMGGVGSDAAIEAADIVLMQDNPTAIHTAKRISKKTLGIVKENIVFSIAIKIIVLILSATGLLDLISFGMIIAILADVGVCVLAILNSMRALLLPKQKKEKTAKSVVEN
ncbi:MAG: cadmium-translocating P-type ATPase [Corallococcus sp.]|nr:cadmium-translocating P-type ATPase [Corallococcus sp.]MCM1360157.1 cadmium-translocating P-type ATPase [Corallococcus sp.]MCM1395754.1 cadmium-translocating P-type ATPase [Corallococcus sp.]